MKFLVLKNKEVGLFEVDDVVGPRGPVGLTGETGARGPIGLQGNAGPRGLQGERGGIGLRGPKGFDGRDGTNGQDGSNGKNGRDGINGRDGANGIGLPAGGSDGFVLAKASNRDYDFKWVMAGGVGYRQRLSTIEASINSLQGGATGISSTYAAATYQPIGSYANSSDAASFYALKTTAWVTSTWVGSNYQPLGSYVNSDGTWAKSADVSSFYALKTTTWAMSTWVGSNYQPLGSYVNSDGTWALSSDVASWYPTKVMMAGSLATFATSASVSSANATFVISNGTWAVSADVSSWYLTKAMAVGSAVLYANSDGTLAKSVDVTSSYAQFMGKTVVWSLASPASRGAEANSVAWSISYNTGTDALGFVTFPQSPRDGQEMTWSFAGIVTTLTITVVPGSTQLVSNPPTAAAAGGVFKFKWTQSRSTWFRA